MNTKILTPSLLLLLLVSINAISQVTGNTLKYEEVIKTDSSLSKKTLHSMGIQWFSNSYRDSKEVIQYQDQELGFNIGMVAFRITVAGVGISPNVEKNISYNIKLSFKQGKIKYEIYDFIDESMGHSYIITDGEPTYKGIGSKTAKSYYEDTKNQVRIYAEKLKNSIISYFNTPIKEDNW